MAERSEAKSAKRSFASKYFKFLFLTRSFASRFLLRFAQPFLAKFKWTINWSLSPQGLNKQRSSFGQRILCKKAHNLRFVFNFFQICAILVYDFKKNIIDIFWQIIIITFCSSTSHVPFKHPLFRSVFYFVDFWFSSSSQVNFSIVLSRPE